MQKNIQLVSNSSKQLFISKYFIVPIKSFSWVGAPSCRKNVIFGSFFRVSGVEYFLQTIVTIKVHTVSEVTVNWSEITFLFKIYYCCYLLLLYKLCLGSDPSCPQKKTARNTSFLIHFSGYCTKLTERDFSTRPGLLGASCRKTLN